MPYQSPGFHGSWGWGRIGNSWCYRLSSNLQRPHTLYVFTTLVHDPGGRQKNGGREGQLEGAEKPRVSPTGPIKPKLLLVSLSGYLGAGTPKEEVPGGPFWLTGAVQLVTQLCADSVSGWGPVLHIFRRKVTQGPPHPWDTPPSRLPPWGLGTQSWAWKRASASLCTVCP